MVATRNHPKDFPPPVLTESPTKRTTRSSTASPPSPTQSVAPRSTTSAAQTNSSSSTSRASKRNAAGSVGGWIHTPSNLTLIWLAVSLPLVIWDTGYVLLRPHSMPGGWLHKPIWSPYALYGTIDYVYGFPAYEAGDGWTAAQGWFNALETAAYLVYLWLVYSHGTPAAVPGRGAPDPDTVDAVGAPGVFKRLSESRVLHGRIAAIAVLIGYSTALVTFVKTVLYWLIEALSGFASIGHNDVTSLVFLWIIPNGLWLIFPAYMLFVFAREIAEGLETAVSEKKRQ